MLTRCKNGWMDFHDVYDADSSKKVPLEVSIFSSTVYSVVLGDVRLNEKNFGFQNSRMAAGGRV